jgi:hypothetical protein
MDQLINRLIEKASEQGFSVLMLCAAVYYLNGRLLDLGKKIQDCEDDRLKLWERIATHELK